MCTIYCAKLSARELVCTNKCNAPNFSSFKLLKRAILINSAARENRKVSLHEWTEQSCNVSMKNKISGTDSTKVRESIQQPKCASCKHFLIEKVPELFFSKLCK